MILEYAAVSEAGPRAENQDAWGVQWLADLSLLACVADGVGGTRQGGTASNLGVALFMRGMARDPHQNLEECLQGVHGALIAESKRNSDDGMATTFTAALLQGGRLVGVHVGDSRLLLIRGGAVRQLTTDHTEVGRLVREGLLSKAAAAEYPRRHILEAALGVGQSLDVQYFDYPLWPGDKLVFTTDGVHNKITKREIRELSATSKRPYQLVSTIAERVRKRRADDNFTAIVVSTGEDQQLHLPQEDYDDQEPRDQLITD